MHVLNKIQLAILASCAALPVLAQAQQASADAVQLERVQVTGSAIKQIAGEGALPVTVLNQDDIKRSGATSVTELIQALPQMQGFVNSSMSINSGSGSTGGTTAALHALDQKYTLVLLDGHRFAPFSGDGTVNLSNIPLDAVERVEVLTDGASAIYGSDAIAGVVNFILKKDKTDGNVFANYSSPQKAGGKSYNIGFAKGFGDIEKDRFNFLLTYSHDKQDALQASQRDVSKRGVDFGFSAQGKNYWFNQSTTNTEPANLIISSKDQTISTVINPYWQTNGNCGTALAFYAPGEGCKFNYAATVQDIPSSVRDGGLASLRVKLNNDTSVYAQLALSRFKMTAQFAPPAQPMSVTPDKLSSIWNSYVVPVIGNQDPANITATLGERVVGSGGRTDDFITDNRHLVLGVDGLAGGWDYSLSLVLSANNIRDNAAGGYLDYAQFADLVAKNKYNPALPIAGQNAALIPATLHSNFSTTDITMNQLSLHASRELFQLPAGMASVATGVDFTSLHHVINYSDLILYGNNTVATANLTDYPVGGNYGQIPFDASRNNYGIFGELALPLAKNLDASLAARYDNYSKVHNKQVYDPNSGAKLADADQGNTFDSTTYKGTLRFQPSKEVLLRGSYGTGFKAPNMPDIAGALAYNGSSQTFACPFPGSPTCIPGNAQYDLVAGGNALSGANGIKPEKSTQWTVGFRVDPFQGLSMGADLWNVDLQHQIISAGIPQSIAFNNPQQYANLFINPYVDPAIGKTIAYIQSPFNLGQANYRGVDWDMVFRTKTGLGQLTTAFSGTYMLKQRYQLIDGGNWNTDLGVFGPDQKVVFRTQLNLQMSLKTQNFLNTLSAHYKSGYKDQSFQPGDAAIFNVDASGKKTGDPIAFAGLDVPSYTTWDWQTRYDFSKALQLTAGVKNLFDRAPPLSLQNGGGGNQAGYDGRYADPLGRTFYLTGSYRF